jgi:hypothetical protein
MVVIEKKDFDSLFAVLGRRGYTIVGPRARDGAIVLDQLASAGDLPHGWTADQAPAHFTMRRRSDDAFFGFTVGPHSWKRYLYPPRTHLFAAVRNGKGFDVTIPTNGAGTKYAFLGVRPCELQALNLLDRVFANGQYADAGYAERRASAFVIAVNCVEPSGTCFCASMDTGPAARQGFDIVLTEIVDGDRHYFMADSGTETGAGVLGEIPHRPAEREEVVLLEGTMKSSAERMGRAMVKADFRPLANAQFEAPEWDEVARR